MSKAVVTIETEDGVELALRARFEVCPRCQGEGSHVNPAVDGNGLTAEDFDQDPDFHEAYMADAYDVPCEQCRGKRVVAVVDESRLTPDQQAEYSRHALAQREYERDYASERWLRYVETGVMG